MSRAAGTLLVAYLMASPSLGAQSQPADSTKRNPHAVQPERPTVATHAGTVARGCIELEEGGEWDKGSDGVRSFIAPTNLKIGLAQRAQLNLLVNLVRNPIAGGSFETSSVTVGVKYRIVDDDRILGDFAVLPAVRTVGVMGDDRTYAYPIIIRAVTRPKRARNRTTVGIWNTSAIASSILM